MGKKNTQTHTKLYYISSIVIIYNNRIFTNKSVLCVIQIVFYQQWDW